MNSSTAEIAQVFVVRSSEKKHGPVPRKFDRDCNLAFKFADYRNIFQICFFADARE